MNAPHGLEEVTEQKHNIAAQLQNNKSAMSLGGSAAAAKPLALTEELEKLEQSITLTLQGWFCVLVYCLFVFIAWRDEESCD